MSQSGKVFQTSIQVRYQETDQMGVVYHANYLVWFEVARTSLIRALGYSYRDLEEKGIILPVVEAHANYRSPARYEDQLTVEVKITELKGSKLKLEYRVVRDEDQKLLCTGHSIHIWCNSEMKRLNLEKEHPEVFRALQKAL